MTTWLLICMSASVLNLDAGEYSTRQRCFRASQMQMAFLQKTYGPRLRCRCVTHTQELTYTGDSDVDAR